MPPEPQPRVPTGTPGLDQILRGGLPAGRTCLVQGTAGTGKTTLALQFLREGLRRGERCLYLTLLQSSEELDDVAASHAWDLDGLEVAHVPQDVWDGSDGQTLFSTYDIEVAEIAGAMSKLLSEHRPERLVIDSVGELGMLVDSMHQLRRSLLRLKIDLARSGCTALVTAGDATVEIATALDTIFNGVIRLTRETVLYGRTRRRLEVVKQRGLAYLEGRHDLQIRTGELEVYPRLEYVPPAREGAGERPEMLSSGVAELDDLTGGGLPAGSACLVTGNAGAGKTTIASLYARAAAATGRRAAIYCFDERRDVFMARAEGLGIDLRSHLDRDEIEVRELAVGEISGGAFIHAVRQAVEERGAGLVVIDSVTGYLQAMNDAQEVTLQLHELLAFLGRSGVLTLLIVAEHGPPFGDVTIDASYLADSVLLLRHFEARGELHRCIAMTKKRHGAHEQRLRQLVLQPRNVKVGPPLEFEGVLAGRPVYNGDHAHVMGSEDDARRDGTT